MANPNLQELVVQIIAVGRTVGLRHHIVLREYPLTHYTADNFEDFQSETVAYCRYHFSRTLGGESPGEQYADGTVWGILQRAYRGGAEEAFRNAREGLEGGLLGVLGKIAETLRKQHEEYAIGHLLRRHINPLSFTERAELMRQFLARTARFLPEDAQPKTPEELAHSWEELVKFLAAQTDALSGSIGSA